MSDVLPSRLRVALFHALPPGGAVRALFETVKRFSPDIEVHLFSAQLDTVDRRFAGLTEGTSQLDLSELVAATRNYPLPTVARVIGSRVGPIGAFVICGEAMRHVQRQMADDINAGGYDVAFVHACRFSLSVPIAEWLTVPTVYYAQEIRRVGFEVQPSPLGVGARSPASLIPLVRRPYERVCRRRDRRAVAAVDRILCNSRFSADMLSAVYGVDPVVCYLGVDAGTFYAIDQATTPAKQPRASSLRVMSVGALHPVKGHDLALRAAARAAELLGEAAELHVVYERQRAGYQKELEELARLLGVGLVFHRGISDAELADLYRHALVTVCTARLEPFGLTSLESMSCGTPVVAVAQGGLRETVIDGLNGYLVERDAVSVADGIVRVARKELNSSPNLLHDFVSDKWTWQAASDRIVRQLRLAATELAGNRQRSGAARGTHLRVP